MSFSACAGLRRAIRSGSWLVLMALLLAACSRNGEPSAAKAQGRAPAVPVTVAPVVQRDVPVRLTAIGNVQAYSTVGVLAQVGGELLAVHFKEGQEVRQGELLFTIDPRPFQSALQQARAQLAQHQAQVRQAEANLARDTAQLENARVDERRYRELLDRQLIARQQYDQVRTNTMTLEATIQADQAAVTNARAAVQADEAAVENVVLQLNYTEIRAPLNGRTGNLLIQRGNIVKANDVGNPLVVITRVQPIYVSFAVPERQLEEIKRHRAAGDLRVEATVPGQPAPVRGELTFVNNTVDVATGTIQLKATFPNAENALWPGQFVNVELTLTTQPRALVVPSQAIQRGQQGTYVFVVKPDLTVEQRAVEPGLVDGRDVVITRGLAPGERVVTDGQLRLVPGARVDIKAG
jgi:multidrug efflux system membrane fusion protein